MDRVVDTYHLEGWVPVRLYPQADRPFVDWCYMGRRRFTDPSFSQTIEACIHQPFNLLFRHQTPIEVLGRWTERHAALQPAGFIFHVSRCGSTLVSRMLAAIPDHIVISEAPPIDSAIRARSRFSKISEERQVDWLRWMIAALGQRRAGSETRLFIKFDAWNILDLPLVRRAFPTVPWLFLYRDPIEVLVSQLRHRGPHMVPGVFAPAVFGLDQNAVDEATPEEFCSRILGALYRAGLQYHRDGGMLVNYSQLPSIVFSSLLQFFGFSYSASELENMREIAKFDAKNPRLFFTDDTQKKNARATEAVRKAATDWMYPVYEELEKERLADRLQASH
jgi:hypothetical protein